MACTYSGVGRISPLVTGLLSERGVYVQPYSECGSARIKNVFWDSSRKNAGEGIIEPTSRYKHDHLVTLQRTTNRPIFLYTLFA